MSLLPRKIIYDLGRDRHSRRIALIVENGTFVLHREPGYQGEEEVWLEITRDQVLALIEVVS